MKTQKQKLGVSSFSTNVATSQNKVARNPWLFRLGRSTNDPWKVQTTQGLVATLFRGCHGPCPRSVATDEGGQSSNKPDWPKSEAHRATCNLSSSIRGPAQREDGSLWVSWVVGVTSSAHCLPTACPLPAPCYVSPRRMVLWEPSLTHATRTQIQFWMSLQCPTCIT